VICDVFAPGALRAAMISAAPEVVVNALTDLAGGLDERRWMPRFAVPARSSVS